MSDLAELMAYKPRAICEQCGKIRPVVVHEDYGVICADCLEGFGPCGEDELPR